MVLKGHDDYIRSIKGLINGKLATSSRDNSLRIWSISEHKQIGILEGHMLPVWSIEELNEQFIASGASDFTIIIWNI